MNNNPHRIWVTLETFSRARQVFTLRQKTSVLSQGVMQHSSEKGGLCSTFYSSEMLQISKFEFYLINALVYVVIDQGIHKAKLKVAWNEIKTTWVVFLFFFYKYGKFLKHFAGTESWSKTSFFLIVQRGCARKNTYVVGFLDN